MTGPVETPNISFSVYGKSKSQSYDEVIARMYLGANILLLESQMARALGHLLSALVCKIV